MDHQTHSRLIAELTEKVQAEPPTSGFQVPYFQACWSVAKKIGPNFKTTAYPHPQDRELAWKRYDKAITKLKLRQAAWEKSAVEKLAAIEALIAQAVPPDLRMEALLNEREVSSRLADKKEALRLCSEKYKEGLGLFMASKELLSHEQFKGLSSRFRDLRRQLKSAWDALSPRNGTAPQGKKTDSVRNKEGRREGLVEKLRNEHAGLEHQQQTMAKLQRELEKCSSPEERGKIESWIQNCREAIATLERDILVLETKLSKLA